MDQGVRPAIEGSGKETRTKEERAKECDAIVAKQLDPSLEPPEDPRHVQLRAEMAATSAMLDAYERDMASDPKRAAFREEVRHLMYRGADENPTEDLGLAPYRLGANVPELAMEACGVPPLPE